MSRSPGDQSNVRREYSKSALTRAALEDDPCDQFAIWLGEAQQAELVDATAMTLATANAQGEPSARIVLLKRFDAHGFVFFTDYGSQKGQELAVNPRAELLFYWRELERQVRISGIVEKVSREESATYFASRPLDSQISASISAQSQPIDARETLEARASALQSEGKIIPPEDWGGYSLAPARYEFWQGRPNRLHDRFSYTKASHGWEISRLQP